MQLKVFESKIDELGRVLIPIEVRQVLGWEVKDDIKFEITENGLLLNSKKISKKENAE